MEEKDGRNRALLFANNPHAGIVTILCVLAAASVYPSSLDTAKYSSALRAVHVDRLYIRALWRQRSCLFCTIMVMHNSTNDSASNTSAKPCASA